MKKISLTIFLIMMFSIIGFSQADRTVFLNGTIYTLDPQQPYVESVVTGNNKIIFAGPDEEAREFIDRSAEVIDLRGKLMLPGFIDAHVHLIWAGFSLIAVNLHSVKSHEEFAEKLRAYVLKNPGKWITGGYWDHEQWDIKSPPTRQLIDSFTSDIPVFLERIDGHMGIANTYALKLAGIDRNTKDPEGGLIVKDSLTGEPTGILKDNAMSLIYRVIPSPTLEENYSAALKALETLRMYGVTGVHDISNQEHIKIYKKLEEKEELSCRLYSILPVSDYNYLAGSLSSITGEKIKAGGLKAFADGSLGSGTAWFFEPYEDDKKTAGLPSDIVLNGKLEEWAFEAEKNNLQLCVHAIGDRANKWILDLYEKIRKENSLRDRRFRIEHAQHIRFSDIIRLSRNNIIASCQPYHAIDDGVWAEKRIGSERIKYSYPFRSFLDSGAMLSFGSDWPVAPVNPLLGIYAAVTRKTLDGKNPDGWIPEERITVEEAVKCYTINNAFASFEEKLKGSIEKGKLADLVVLDQNIFKIDPEMIKDVKVLITVLGGKIIYDNR